MTVTGATAANDDDAYGHFEGDPPTRAEIDQDHRVEFTIGLLDQAGRGQHVAFALNTAMAAVVSPHRRPLPISPAQRDRLLAAAIRAEIAADREFADRFGVEIIRLGMRGLSFQIVRWADAREPGRRAPARSDFPADVYARILRNTLHNVDLIESLLDRSGNRSGNRRSRVS